MNDLERNVKTYCKEIGQNLDYVQGAGGNVSWKDGETLWVKASGTWLVDALEKDIFVGVDLPAYLNELSLGNFGTAPVTVKGDAKLKASIETLFHAAMPHKVVVHTHLIDALIYLVQDQAEEKIRQKILGRLNTVFVPYRKPGQELGEMVYKFTRNSLADIIFLENHGVIVAAENIAEIRNKYDLLRKYLKHDSSKSAAHFSPTLKVDQFDNMEMQPDRAYHLLGLNKLLFNRLDEIWALYPDHLVFLGAAPAKFESLEAAQPSLSANNMDYVIVRDLGVITHKNISQNKIAMLEFYTELVSRFDESEKLKTLSSKDVDALLNWDAEKYRQSITR